MIAQGTLSQIVQAVFSRVPKDLKMFQEAINKPLPKIVEEVNGSEVNPQE